MRRHLAILTLSGAIFAFAQAPPPDAIVLPADKTDAEITLALRSELPKVAKVNPPRLLGPKGVPISPQPVFADPVVTADKLSLKISKIYFWGDATLQFEPVPGLPNTYPLRRGPALASTEVPLARRGTGQLWLYNFDTQPVAVRWRIVSGAETLCGIKDGQPLRDCATPDKWSAATLGPARSDIIAFTAPDWWFNPWQVLCACVRQAQLELLFGDDAAAPLLRLPLKLRLDARVWDYWWLPAWAGTTWGKVLDVLWVTFWVTLGAVSLMMAQVMIPNFRKCLGMESQAEALRGRLRALGNAIGDGSLYTRCNRELENARLALALGQSVKSKVFSWDRLLLSSNTAEVNRIAGMLPGIESRIRLTERLDDVQLVANDSGSGNWPPSFSWNRAQQLRKVQGILSGHVITDADEKTATTILDLLLDPTEALKDFSTELDKRIAGLRRQLGMEPWETKYGAYVAVLNGCVELVHEKPQAAPEGGWTIKELALRDLAAVRLAVVCEMIAIEPLLTANEAVKNGILEKLQSDDPAVLHQARVDVVKLSQRIYEDRVQTALEQYMWDANYDPVTVTNQDVLHASLVFRDKDINRCEAKNSFQCFWKVSDGDPQNDTYELGWDVQILPSSDKMIVIPEIYDATGKEVTIRPLIGAETDKGEFSVDVVAAPSKPLHKRLLRGLIDAALTAVVPVISVALAQINQPGSPSIHTLIVIGFTSQAIRAVVVPDPVRPAA